MSGAITLGKHCSPTRQGGRAMRTDWMRLVGLCTVAGIAPMIQILRAFLHYQVGQGTPGPTSASGVKLVYAAERQYDLCFTQLLQDIREKHNDFFNYYVVLVGIGYASLAFPHTPHRLLCWVVLCLFSRRTQNQPPLGWTEGVGYVEHDTIKKHLPFPP